MGERLLYDQEWESRKYRLKQAFELGLDGWFTASGSHYFALCPLEDGIGPMFVPNKAGVYVPNPERIRSQLSPLPNTWALARTEIKDKPESGERPVGDAEFYYLGKSASEFRVSEIIEGRYSILYPFNEQDLTNLTEGFNDMEIPLRKYG